jgi:hypothetical protein
LAHTGGRADKGINAAVRELGIDRTEAQRAVLERAEHLARRKALYEAAHPKTRRGVAGAHASNAVQGNASETVSLAFKDQAATTARVSPRSIQQDIQIATSIVGYPIEERVGNFPSLGCADYAPLISSEGMLRFEPPTP